MTISKSNNECSVAQEVDERGVQKSAPEEVGAKVVRGGGGADTTEAGASEEASPALGLSMDEMAVLDAETRQILQDALKTSEELDELIKQQGECMNNLTAERDEVNAQIRHLKDETWRLEAYQELEQLKQELMASAGISSDMLGSSPQEEAGGQLKAEDQPQAELGLSLSAEPAAAAEEAEVEEEESAAEAAAALEGGMRELAALEQQMEAMLLQLQRARLEAAAAAEKKQQLEAQLQELNADMPLPAPSSAAGNDDAEGGHNA